MSMIVIENPNVPLLVLKPQTPSVCFEYNSKDANSLISGQHNGVVAVWDLRKSCEPVELSVIEVSHRDPVSSVLWISSKSGAEFFSGSTDGQLKWWDTRKLSQPLETLILDYTKDEEQILTNAFGASCIEYEPTIPTRFMVGTEQGIVISCNRKVKTAMEKMGPRYSAHFGPVLALQRNPGFMKNFLTVGDWTVKIFSEDCKESPIMWTTCHKAMLEYAAWGTTRFSIFYTARSDGVLDLWDVLQQQNQASLSVKVCDYPLCTLRPHEMGRLVAVGNENGSIYLVQFSENLAAMSKNDKAMLTTMFERETRREKILEARNRELRLKLKTKSATALEEVKEKESSVMSFSDPLVEAAEKEFFDIIRGEEEKISLSSSKNDIIEENEVEVKKSATELQQPTASEHDIAKSSETKEKK